jgi:hypothetical protein
MKKTDNELTLSPSDCLACEKVDTCYFGRFFHALKDHNCRSKGNKEVCDECSMRNRCVMGKFQFTKSGNLITSNKIFLCEK